MSSGSTPIDLEEIKRRWQPLFDLKQRAAERLTGRPAGDLCFALIGAEVDPAEGFSFDPVALVRPVEEPPTTFGLVTAIQDPLVARAVDRYTTALRYELVILQAAINDRQMALDIAWTIVAALRLRSHVEFLVPAVADHSWATIEGAPARACWAQLLEDAPQARRVSSDPSSVITADHAAWVNANFLRLLDLRANQQFHFAFECLSGSHTDAEYRLMAAKLWAGLEALVGVNQELRFRVSALLAALVEPPGAGRVALYNRIKRLYDVRSKVVHGATLSQEELGEHVAAAQALLADCLIALVELGRVPSSSDLESSLLGVPLQPE